MRKGSWQSLGKHSQGPLTLYPIPMLEPYFCNLNSGRSQLCNGGMCALGQSGQCPQTNTVLQCFTVALFYIWLEGVGVRRPVLFYNTGRRLLFRSRLPKLNLKPYTLLIFGLGAAVSCWRPLPGCPRDLCVEAALAFAPDEKFLQM